MPRNVRNEPGSVINLNWSHKSRHSKFETDVPTMHLPHSCLWMAMEFQSNSSHSVLQPLQILDSELRVEVEAGAHHQGVPVPRDGSSSSGYSSSLGSPRSPLRRSTAFDRTKDVHRRKSLCQTTSRPVMTLVMERERL